jgi:flagellar biosynthesis protein FlhA
LACTKGNAFTEALQNYTVLTIGDGLVSQYRLKYFNNCGLIVTRGGSGGALDFEMKTQLLSNPRVLATVAGMVPFIRIFSGNAYIPLYLSRCVGYRSYLKTKAKKEAVAVQEETGSIASGRAQRRKS